MRRQEDPIMGTAATLGGSLDLSICSSFLAILITAAFLSNVEMHIMLFVFLTSAMSLIVALPLFVVATTFEWHVGVELAHSEMKR